jgi:hypothetical protein
MSQSKEITRESAPDKGLRNSVPGTSRQDALSARLRILLDERARLVEQLELIDLDVDRVRVEAAESSCGSSAAQSAPRADEASFEVTAREFVRGATEPPDEVDRDDFEHCVGKVVLALRRNGDRLAGATLQVRYHIGSGRVLAIVLRREDDPSQEREVYRRGEEELPIAG